MGTISNLVGYILGSTQSPGVGPNIQPNVAVTAKASYGLGPASIPVVATNPYSTAMLETTPAGYTVPDLVFVSGVMPPAPGLYGPAPDTKDVNAPQGGSC